LSSLTRFHFSDFVFDILVCKFYDISIDT
jgi:hypothetical protein